MANQNVNYEKSGMHSLSGAIFRMSAMEIRQKPKWVIS